MLIASLLRANSFSTPDNDVLHDVFLHKMTLHLCSQLYNTDRSTFKKFIVMRYNVLYCSILQVSTHTDPATSFSLGGGRRPTFFNFKFSNRQLLMRHNS